MKIIRILFSIALATVVLSNTLYADWDSVARLPVDSKIEITTRNGARARADFVSSDAATLVTCPQCPNEGAGHKFVGTGAAIGAIAGAAFGFLFHSSPKQTIYKD